MYFNFPIFSRLAKRAYDDIGGSSYSFEEVISVFRYYFQKYEQVHERIHPHIRLEQIERIIEAMPFIDREHSHAGDIGDLEPDDYEGLIDLHFKTEYNVGFGGCDYNINHFFSGDIRLLRYYEYQNGYA